MKRILVCLLALMLLIPAFAAAEDTGAAFEAGFGRANITPDESVPLAGYGNTERRMSDGYLDYLYANVLALRDAKGETVLLIMLDLISAPSIQVTEPIRKAVHTATGVKNENIMVQGSHTHSGPDVYSKLDCITHYNFLLPKLVAQAAEEAVADLQPATLAAANGEIEGLNFVRHYLMNDGTYCGDNYGSESSGYKAHETEADHTIQELLFKRENAEDILVINFQTHPHRTGGMARYDVSSDIVGQVREYVEANTDCVCTYMQGAAGNINPISRITSENRTTDYKVWGEIFGKKAVELMEDMQPIESGDLKVTDTKVTCTINHTEDGKAMQARVIYDEWLKTGNNTKAAQDGAPYDIHSPYHASAIINKTKLGKEEPVQLWALSFGDVGIACAPYEMFDVNGDYIKDNSPFALTLVMGYCNDMKSYIAADYSYDNTCYEADQCRYVKGTAEILAQEFAELLTGLYEEADK